VRLFNVCSACATTTALIAMAAIPAVGVTTPTLEELGNIAYEGIYDDAVTLSAGSYEGKPFVPDGAARPRVELLSDPIVTDDIDEDGWEDAYVLLSESSGGTASNLYLAAVTLADGAARNVGTLLIGDRVDVIALDASDGKAALDYVAAGPNEPACCPTLMVSGTYGLQDGKLAELSRKEKGSLSLATLAGVRWQLAAFDLNEPIAEGVEITAVFDGERVSGFAGCNQYFATVEAKTPYELTVGPVAATRKACPPPQMRAEGRFLKALEGATQFSSMLGKLVLGYRLEGRSSALLLERVEQE